jgi:type VI secretion system secreted protein Hcp
LSRFRLLVTSAVVSVFAALGVVAPAEAAVDYFLEIEGIPGESRDAKEGKSIDVLSYSWSASAANADKKSTSQFGGFTIAKLVDVASPPLFQHVMSGETIPDMELIGRKAGENQLTFLRLCFQDVRVSSIQQGDSRGSESPTESVSFSYGSQSQQYTMQSPTGGAGSSIFAGWNASTGQLISSYPPSCG